MKGAIYRALIVDEIVCFSVDMHRDRQKYGMSEYHLWKEGFTGLSFSASLSRS
jgi:hypothetical protein